MFCSSNIDFRSEWKILVNFWGVLTCEASVCVRMCSVWSTCDRWTVRVENVNQAQCFAITNTRAHTSARQYLIKIYSWRVMIILLCEHERGAHTHPHTIWRCCVCMRVRGCIVNLNVIYIADTVCMAKWTESHRLPLGNVSLYYTP